MATNYISAADVDAIIGTELRQALFTDDASGSTYDSVEFDRACELCSIVARAALENAGYSTGTSTTNDMVTVTALSVFFNAAFGRKKLEVPAGVQAIFGAIPEGVRIGQIPVPDLDPTARDAVGGSDFTDSSTNTSTGKPSVMSDLRNLF